MSPFRSDAQRKYMFAKMPKLAHKWADKYGTKPVADRKTREMAVKIMMSKRKGK